MQLALIIAVPAAAQAQIEEIVVTARKKEESLQEVPISISAFSAKQMEARGIRDNYDVAKFTPNFTTSQRVGRDSDRPTIRGMSNPGSRGEPNASYFIDGTFVARTISTATTASMERVEVIRGPQSALFGRATFSGAVNYVTRKPSNDFEGEVFARGGTSEDAQVSGWWSGPIVEDNLAFLVSGAYNQYGGQWNNQLLPGTGGPVSANGYGGDPGAVFVDGLVNSLQTITFKDVGKGYQDQNTQGDFSPLGETETWDFLGKLSWTPGDATELNFKYSFTKGDDGHYPNNIFDTANCYVPTPTNDPANPLNTDPTATEDWWATSPGAYCGETKVDGTVNRKNIPDLRDGLTVINQLVSNNPPALTPDQLSSTPSEPGLRRETHRVLGEWIQDISGWTSVLKAAWSDDDFDSTYDLDHQPVRAVWGLFGFNNVFKSNDFSLEYFIDTPADEPVRARLGVYYYDQELTDIQRSFTGPLPATDTPPGTDPQDPRTQEIQNSSIFGALSFDLTDQWTLDLEARYAKDEKSIKSGQRSGVDPTVSDPVSDSLSFTAFTPRVTMQFAPTDDMNFYFLIAKGNKPGGFNTEFFRSDVPSELTRYYVNCDPNNPGFSPVPGFQCSQEVKDRLTFKEEDQWTYETGIKSTWWDQRILANLSIFYIDWRNQGLFSLQDLPAPGGGINTTTIITNAGRSEIYGLELETNYMVNEHLNLFLNYGYNHGEFIEGFDPDYEAITGDGDLAGNTLFDSPAHSVVTGFDVRSQVSDRLEGFVRADFLYESKRFNNQSNLSWIGERKIVNFRTGFDTETWTATIYVRNLLNDDTPLSFFNFVDFAAQAAEKTYEYIDAAGKFANGETPAMGALNPQPTRDWGLEVQYRF